MKKITIKFLTILTLSMSLGSCSDFLDVRPQSSFPDYLMFSTPEGFVHALNGTYLVMRGTLYHPDSHYYGGYNKNSVGFFESMGCGWVVDNNLVIAPDANLYAHNYDYYQLEGSILSFFKGQYKIITNLNLILKWIDDEEQTFLGDELYSVVKGEALALRSYLLFELIQTFGPPPTSTALHGNKYIPYPKTITTDPYNKETYTKYMELLWADIVEAERLLEQYDPIIQYSVAQLAVRGDWSKRRHNKMNYYALMGLKARVQLYQGDKPGALASALTVINAKNEDGSDKFPFMPTANYDVKTDLIGVSEHMFAFEHDNLARSWTLTTSQAPQNFIASTELLKESFSRPGKYEIAFHGLYLQNRFPDAVLHNDYGLRSQDLRLEKWFSRSTTGVNMICQKYYPLTQTGHSSALPIMRKGEMLLIAAECEPDLDKAAGYINILREARWISSVTVGNKYKLKDDGTFILPKEVEYEIKLNQPYTNVTFADEYDRMEWVIGEYSREFIMEGRSFFAWKRLGLGLSRLNPALKELDKIPFPTVSYEPEKGLWTEDDPSKMTVAMTDEAYIVPVPKNEINYEDLQ